MAHCLRHIIRDEKNDAIVHILLRIIDRFFEKALDQYYSQLSEAVQLDQKKDQTRKYKWKDKQKSIKFCLLKRMAEYEKNTPMVYCRVVVTFGYKKIKQIKKLSDRYLIGLTFGQKQI